MNYITEGKEYVRGSADYIWEGEDINTKGVEKLK